MTGAIFVFLQVGCGPVDTACTRCIACVVLHNYGKEVVTEFGFRLITWYSLKNRHKILCSIAVCVRFEASVLLLIKK